MLVLPVSRRSRVRLIVGGVTVAEVCFLGESNGEVLLGVDALPELVVCGDVTFSEIHRCRKSNSRQRPHRVRMPGTRKIPHDVRRAWLQQWRTWHDLPPDRRELFKLLTQVGRQLKNVSAMCGNICDDLQRWIEQNEKDSRSTDEHT